MTSKRIIRSITVYDSSYTLRGSYATRAEAMTEAERLAGKGSTCRIERDGNAVIAIYTGSRGQFAAADGARPVFL